MKSIWESSSFTPRINSYLSFLPLFRWWENKLKGAEKLHAKQLQQLLDEVKNRPFLLQEKVDMADLEAHEADFLLILRSVFPASVDQETSLFLMSLPFNLDVVYSSKAMEERFLNSHAFTKSVVEARQQDMYYNKLFNAYKIIFKKFYSLDIEANSSLVYRTTKESGVEKFYYSELNIDFVDVFTEQSLPELDVVSAGCTLNEPCINDLQKWQELLPLEQFTFAGFCVVTLKDFTPSEAISELNNELLKEHDITSPIFLNAVEKCIASLFDDAGLIVGIAAFQKFEDEYLVSDRRLSNSFLLRYLYENEDIGSYHGVVSLLGQINAPIFLDDIELEAKKKDEHHAKLILEMGIKEVIIMPLYHEGKLVGMLEICSKQKGKLKHSMLEKLKPLQQPLAIALLKDAKQFEFQVQQIIRKNYTAIQPVIEWKFNEVAVKKILDRENGLENEVSPVIFEDVYPLYAAVDIRNSSANRVEAIQKDLRQQLTMAHEILLKAQSLKSLPVLEKMNFKIIQMLEAIQLILVPEDEAVINQFIHQDLEPLFQHLQKVHAELSPAIAHYFGRLDPKMGMLYENRAAFEKSLETINSALSSHIDAAQTQAQEMFPHYFEKYKTDGVEYNIYIGQSLVKDRVFDPIYLKNLKLWQLTVLCECAFIGKSLQSTIDIPLETTQLLLAHSVPLSISFRVDERKFDVEGAYNIRYEIMKKRIDKALIKGSLERLTQPGAVAIIYSHPEEAREYLDYVSFLQTKGLLGAKVEQLDLEDLQGVNGLKAIRVELGEEVRAIPGEWAADTIKTDSQK